MKPGDDYQCPQCKKETFLKKESVMDGWTKKGDVLKCASCGHVACELSEKTNSETHSSDPLKSSAAERFKSILGVDDFEKKPVIDSSEEETRFCKDCIHLIPHPFILRCSRFNKDVNPMDDCPDFKKRIGK